MESSPLSFDSSLLPSTLGPPSFNLFSRLPSAILEQVCGCLPPKELLLGLAQTAKTTRVLLSPRCCASHSIRLTDRHVELLSSLFPPSSDVSSFHTRVLTECRLTIVLNESVSREAVLDCLHHFPICGELKLESALNSRLQYGLLHSPAAQSCHVLHLEDSVQAPMNARLLPAKRKRAFDGSGDDGG